MATKPVFDDIAAWPSQTPNPRAVIGANKPPLEEVIPAEFRAALLADKPDFLTKFEALVDAASRAQAVDEATLGRCGNLINSYRDCISHIDKTHVAVKAPHLLSGRLVDSEKNALRTLVDAAKLKVESIGNAYVAKREAALKAERDAAIAEQRRLAGIAAEAERKRMKAEADREIAERALARAERKGDDDALAAAEARRLAAIEKEKVAEAALASASLAPAMPAAPEPIRSDEGAVVSGKQDWCSKVSDYSLAYAAVEDNPKVREAVEKAIAQLVRAGKRTIAGVDIWPVAKANFR